MKFVVLSCVLSICLLTDGQTRELPDSVGVMFYNVENLFDCWDDSLKNDQEFLPQGEKYWNYDRYNKKLKSIARVIFESGGWNPPVMVGLCEIENQTVLNHLIYKYGLKNLGYRFIHYESSDFRGIDVALLYRAQLFKLLESHAIPVALSKGRATRDILYVKGVLAGIDTLHVFVNHWPSRYGGVAVSVNKRKQAAEVLFNKCNALLCADPETKIIIMGDFNDDPDDESIQFLTQGDQLINLSMHFIAPKLIGGTLKYKYAWNKFDQIIVSSAVMHPSIGSYHAINCLKVIHLPYLTIEDKTYPGIKPYRTYNGYTYQGGYSDHLPVWMTLKRTDIEF